MFDPELLAAIGRNVGEQIRVVRGATEFALFTVSDSLQDVSDRTVRMGLDGIRRLGIETGFDGRVVRQATNTELNDFDAEQAGELVERLVDEADHRQLIAIAPHGGDIEPLTDLQAEHVRLRLAGHAVSSWRCMGWRKPKGAAARWHITSIDISEASFPLLNTIIARGFTHAVAFHGFNNDDIADKPDVLVGGAAPKPLRQEFVTEITNATAGTGLVVRLVRRSDHLNGSDRRNIVNRLTATGTNGIQIEQSAVARDEHWEAIADTVANVYARLLTS